jgi:hypothetical protein
MGWRRLASVAIVSGAALSAGLPSHAAAQAIEGCWFFERDAATQALNLPWGVQLSADSLVGWPGLAHEPDVRVAVTLEGRSATANHPFGYWQTLGADTLRIGYPGMGGLVLYMARQGRRLLGTARPVGDAGSGPDRAVRLIQGPCPTGN